MKIKLNIKVSNLQNGLELYGVVGSYADISLSSLSWTAHKEILKKVNFLIPSVMEDVQIIRPGQFPLPRTFKL